MRWLQGQRCDDRDGLTFRGADLRVLGRFPQWGLFSPRSPRKREVKAAAARLPQAQLFRVVEDNPGGIAFARCVSG